MTIALDHTIVAVNDRQRSARFLTDLVGLDAATPTEPFIAVRINDQLTLDFDDRRGAQPSHYGFLVDDDTFDRVLGQADRLGAEFGSGPERGWDRSTYEIAGGGRGVYVCEPDGHSYEFFTRRPN